MNEAILMLLRHPKPGRVKTRLIPRLGAEGAAAFYREMADRVAVVVRRVEREGLERIAYFDPAPRHEEISRWMGRGFTMLPQPGGDLGQRLEHGFAWAFSRGAARVAAIGTDCVEITPDHLVRAFDALSENEAAVGPARDGGYWLIGLSRPTPEAFREIPWSTERTCEETLTRLATLGLKVHLLPTLKDIDRPKDVLRHDK